MTKDNKNVKNLVLAAMFLALGLIMPVFTAQIPKIGSMLLPMHLPVMLCGMICGWQYGGAVGLIVPILRSVIFGLPPMFPTAIAMTFELAAYGAVVGLVYMRFQKKGVLGLYCSLIIAMLCGRVVWGISRIVLSGIGGEAFTWHLFMSGAFLTALPGIILQLILIPLIMVTLDARK